jgi:hypothetical protein
MSALFALVIWTVRHIQKGLEKYQEFAAKNIAQEF